MGVFTAILTGVIAVIPNFLPFVSHDLGLVLTGVVTSASALAHLYTTPPNVK